MSRDNPRSEAWARYYAAHPNVVATWGEANGYEPRWLDRAARTAAQIEHLEEHQAAFEDDKGPDVAEYMADYGHIRDLYQRVCEDLQIEVRPEICHPNPED